MKLQRFDRPFLGAWWSKVFGQPAMGEVPERPVEVANAVQPVFEFLGSSKHVAKSIYNVNGAGTGTGGVFTAPVPSPLPCSGAWLGTALPVPGDEIWVCDHLTYWHDDAVGQWALPAAVFPDGQSYQLLGVKHGDAAGTPYIWDTKLILPAGWKLGIFCNGPLVGGKKYWFQFAYVPLKVGETLNPF